MILYFSKRSFHYQLNSNLDKMKKKVGVLQFDELLLLCMCTFKLSQEILRKAEITGPYH